MSREVRLSDRIKELSHDPGTSSFNLAGAVNGFSPFGDFYQYGDVVYYAATDGTRYEVGSGEYVLDGSNNSLTRYPLRSNRLAAGPYYLDGKSACGATAGVTGYFHPMYLTKSAASGVTGATSVHEHCFSGYPGVTFYMPNNHAGHGEPTHPALSGVNYATSGAPVGFQGITEVFVTYPGKYSVFSAGGVSGYQEPRSGGVAVWGTEQILNYDSNIVWDVDNEKLGISQPTPQYAIDVGSSVHYSQIRASGFIGGGSGVAFSGGSALPQDITKTASGGRQLEPFYRNELDNQTGTDAVFSLSGLVDHRLLFQKQVKGAILSGPPSGCGASCSPDYPTFRYLQIEDVPDLSSLYIVQKNVVDAGLVPVGAIPSWSSSGVVEYDNEFVFLKGSNRLGINTQTPNANLDVNGDAAVSGNITTSGNLWVGGDVTVSGSMDIQGNVTYIDSSNVTIWDKQLELASMSGIAFYNDSAIDSGGLVLKSTAGDKFWIWSDSNDAWVTDQKIWASGSSFKFNDGPEISGAYHAGSGLEIHNGIAFNVGNLFQTSGTDGTNGLIHQNGILALSGIKGIDTSFTQLSDGSGIFTIDPTAISGYIVAGDAIISGWVNGSDAIISGWVNGSLAGTYNWKLTDGDVAADTISSAQTVFLSGVSGIDVEYTASDNFMRFSPAPVSGYFEARDALISGYVDARVGGIGGGYGHWKIHDGTTLSNISSTETLTVSGVSGISVVYTDTDNGLRLSAAPASGWNKYYTDASGNAVSGWANAAFGTLAGGYNYWKIHDGTVLDSILTTEVVTISGVSGVDIEYTAADNGLRISTGSLSGWANSSFSVQNSSFSAQSAGSGLIKTEVGGASSLHMDIEGSGQLRQLSFRNDQIRIGEKAGYNSNLGSVIFDASGVGRGTITIGPYAGYNAVDSNLSMIIGSGAGRVASGCSYTNMIGYLAGSYANNCNYTNMIGYAGDWAYKCDNTNMIGFQAGLAATGCDQTNMIGVQAGYWATGCDNTNMIGWRAGERASGCDQTNMIGVNAGYQATGCYYSNMIGFWAGYQASGCDSTNMMGGYAGYQATGCDNTNMMGGYAGWQATGCDSTNIIGWQAGRQASGCDYTNMIGVNAGWQATGCSYANMIGGNAGRQASGCSYANMIGAQAGYRATGCDQTNMMGYYAGYQATGCDQTNMIGVKAGWQATGCSYANMIGFWAGYQASGCDSTNMIGYAAGYLATGCDYTNMMGYYAGWQATGCDSTNMMGGYAGYLATGCDYTNMMGYYAGYRASGCDYTNMIGYEAGRQASGCSYTNMIGNSAGYQASGCDYANMMGFAAGDLATGCDYTNMMGYRVGEKASGCDSTNMIGHEAGYHASGCDETNMIGRSAGSQVLSCDYTNMIGRYTGYQATGCDYSNMIGDRAGYQASGCLRTEMIGRFAGYLASGCDESIFIGDGAGRNSHSMQNSIFIGQYAGKYRTGSDCLIINPYNGNATVGTDPSWSDGDEDGIVSIASLIHGQSYGPASTTKHIRLGADPGSVSDFSSICLSVKSAIATDTVLRLIPFSSSQSAPQLEAIKKNAAWAANPIVNDEGFLRVPVAVLQAAGDLYTSPSASLASKIEKGDGVIAVYNIGGNRYMVVCIGTTWYRTDSLAGL
jgi:hypothetical protein